MTKLIRLSLIPAIALAAACSNEQPQQAGLDEALKNDLALASTAPYPQQQFVSPMEQGYAGAVPNAYGQPQYAMQPVPVGYGPAPRPAATAPARRTSTAARSSGTRTIYRAPRTETVRHTKRDAIIGATAGAVIGATTSRDRVKGGLIGAAAGAVLGGVIGHNVDKQTRTIP